MFRFSRVVCALVGASFGAAIKIKGLVLTDVGLAESPEGDGMAIMNYNQGNEQTEVTVAITDFLPDASYLISVDFGVYAAPMTTNASGNANFHGTVGFDVCAFEPQVCVYVWIDDNSNAVRDDLEIRASGCAPCP